MNMNMKKMLFLFALCAILALTGGAQEVLRGEPLQPMGHDELVADRLKDFFTRQDNERFDPAFTPDPARWVALDLAPLCNMGVFGGDGPKCPVQLPFMRTGNRTFYGVPCRLIDPAANDGRDAVALASARLQPKILPDTVTIPVGRRLEQLYVLLASYYTSAGGEQFFRLDYADGSHHLFPVVGKVDTGDWWHPDTRVYSATTRCVLAPAAEASKTTFRNLHLIRRDNPHPEKEIAGVTIKTDRAGEMAFLVVAVTGYAAGE